MDFLKYQKIRGGFGYVDAHLHTVSTRPLSPFNSTFNAPRNSRLPLNETTYMCALALPAQKGERHEKHSARPETKARHTKKNGAR